MCRYMYELCLFLIEYRASALSCDYPLYKVFWMYYSLLWRVYSECLYILGYLVKVLVILGYLVQVLVKLGYLVQVLVILGYLVQVLVIL